MATKWVKWNPTTREKNVAPQWNQNVEVWTSEWRDKIRSNDEWRLNEYIWKWYTPNADWYLYSPSWQKSNVRIDWSIEWWSELFTPEQIEQATNPTNPVSSSTATPTPSTPTQTAQNQWENADSTVSQWGQNDTNDGSVTVWPMNANLNYPRYWDDSSPENQWTPWWMAEKNQWEWVATSNIEYNPNADINSLDYKYGRNAREQNSKEAWYLARRNDEIASALYNAWLVEKSDIIQYLANQPWWNDSTEADRVNTVEAIWKRLWQLWSEEEWADNWDTTDTTWESIVQDTSGEIYWKTTADSWDPTEWIKTNADANSVFKSIEVERQAKLKEINSMNSKAIAYIINDWKSPFDEQTMRDLQTFNPVKYQEIQNELKQIKWQNIVNQISENWTIDLTSDLDASVNNVNTSMNNFVNSTASGSGAWTLATNLNNALAESEIVSSAREQMEIYKRKIVDIQQSIDELPSLANSYFKWDVPQYIINAFINNRTQKYQSELERYENLYNASLDEAKLEISQEQFNQEMNYKWSSLQADVNYKNANLELSKQELALKMMKEDMTNWQWNDDGSYSYMDLNGVMHTIPKAQAEKVFNTDLYNKSTAYIDYWKNAIEKAKSNWLSCIWWECEAMSDNYTRQSFWTEMRKFDWSKWATTLEEKRRYATEVLPERWYVAVFDFKITDADWVNRWHTGIVIDYDPTTWNFTCLESNVDGNWKVEINTRNINSANLLWFWDPTVAEPRKWNWKTSNVAVDDYLNLPNWMLDVFLSAEDHSSTWELKNYVKQWREWYWILNNMLDNWEVQAILYWDEIWKSIENQLESFKKYVLENASNRVMTDEKWNAFVDTMLQMFINDNDIIDPKERNALAHLNRLIEIKLRRDSWAAINVWEWMKAYDMYMPQMWLSKQQKMQRLFDLERAAIESVMPWEDVVNYVPLITQEMVDAQSEEWQREQAKEEAKKNKKK